MDPNATHNAARIAVRAKALLKQHLNVAGIRFVDEAENGDHRCFAAVVVDGKTGVTVNATTIIEVRCGATGRAGHRPFHRGPREDEGAGLIKECGAQFCQTNAVLWGRLSARAGEHERRQGEILVVTRPRGERGIGSRRYPIRDSERSRARITDHTAAVHLSAESWSETKDRDDTFKGITKYYGKTRTVLPLPRTKLTRKNRPHSESCRLIYW